ncbi:hypothetical protein B0H15DRAFT_1025123, partial [Mycena belliarum]
MSDFRSLLKELETVLAHTAISRYAIVSSLCLFTYDFILTFPVEVEYFWGSPRSFVKGLFFWNRYFVVPVIAYLSFYRTLKIIISALFCIAISSELAIAITKLVTDTVSIQAIPLLVDPLSLCVETIPKFLILYPLPSMIFDAILLALVIYKAYLIQHDETSATANRAWTGARLVRIMFRDSVVYFACTFGVNLFNMLVWALGPYDLFTVGTAWAVTVPVMAANRILFNMRKVYHTNASETLGTLDIGTEFQVA